MADMRFEARMSDLEALMWALEAEDPRLRSTITAVAVLEASPGAEAVRERVERLSRLVPRLRDRVVETGPTAVAPPCWEPDPDFDLAFHLRSVRAPAGARTDAGAGLVPEVVLRMVEPFAAESFDRVRSPWQMLFVEDLPAGRAALAMKLHHTFTDGIGALRLASVLFDLEPGASDGPLPPLPVGPPPPSDAVSRLAGDLAHEARRTLDLGRRAAAALAADVTALLGDPEPAAQARTDLVASLAALAAPASTPHSPLLTGRSGRCRLEVVDVSFDDLRRAGKAAGGTVNDAFVAGLLGGLRHYHDLHGSRPPWLRLAIPVSTRAAAAGPAMRNSVIPVRVDAPLQLTDPGERIRAVHDLVARGRAEPALGTLDQLAVVGNRLGPLRRVLSAAMTGVDVVASNVPGSEVPMYLAGAPLLALVPFGPRSRAALNATVLSHAGVLGIGLNIDPAAAPDYGCLVDAIRVGLDETVGAGS